jgi:hypothetical protein
VKTSNALVDQSNDSLYSKSGLKRVLMTGNLAKFGVAEEEGTTSCMGRGPLF